MGHQGIIKHRREKQRVKNYERWEGLRDEYDEQRKISRESRSLDIQRTGTDYAQQVDVDRPIVSLRDQQEAGDARTSWRPQEAWNDLPERRTSVEVTAGSGLRPLPINKTGSTWDEGLPQPLRVNRRNWDDSSVSRSSSLRNQSGTSTPRDRDPSNAPSMNRPSPRLEAPAPAPASITSHPHASRSISSPVEMLPHQDIEPLEHATPGGRMAELIDLHNAYPPVPYTSPVTQSYGGFPPTQTYSPAMPAPQPQDGSMHEWWNRP